MGALPRKENGCLFFLVDEKQKRRISLGTTFCRFIFNFSHIFSDSNMSREYYDFVSFPIFAVCLTYLLLTFFPDSFSFSFLIEGGCFGWILLTINCTCCFRLFCGTEVFLEKTKIYFSVSSARIWCLTCQKINTSLLFRCRVKN